MITRRYNARRKEEIVADLAGNMHAVSALQRILRLCHAQAKRRKNPHYWYVT